MFAYTRNLPGETVVRVSPSDYNTLTKETIFNCNSPRVYPKSYLVQLIIDKNMIKATLPKMPEEIVARLQRGVLASPMVETSTKNLINP